jgi:hypothetical protein
MMIPEDLKPPDEQPAMPRKRAYVERTSERAYQQSDSLPAAQSPNQDRVTMVKALRRWLQANELPAIVVGVLVALVLLSMILVLGGYLIVTR